MVYGSPSSFVGVLFLFRARLLGQRGQVGVKPPKEGTRSHLSTPNSTAPGRDLLPNLSLAPGLRSLWIYAHIEANLN